MAAQQQERSSSNANGLERKHSEAGSDRESTSVNSRLGNKDEWIKLNVGGTLFLTTKTTLCKEKGTFLARLAQDDPDLPSLKVLEYKCTTVCKENIQYCCMDEVLIRCASLLQLISGL